MRSKEGLTVIPDKTIYELEMAGANKEEVYNEGFSEEDLVQMIGWDDNIKHPVPEGYICDGNIITSISYNFIKWAIAFGTAVGIDVYPGSFGIDS